MNIELSTSSWMFIFFILFLIASIWKIWAFLPNKRLADDDTTEEATAELERLMLKIILYEEGNIDVNTLFFKMSEDEDFDEKLFWRFNLNRLYQLLNIYYAKFPNVSNIEEIYQDLNS